MKAVIIADDFTGANDTGVQFVKKGARTEILMSFGQKASSRADVLVLNTESRGVSADCAREQNRRFLAPLRDQLSDVLLYKKIDSTLRGNIGAEIEVVMSMGQRQVALVAPAIPKMGRITQDGQCLVHGTPLLETEFASDPKTPISSSRIKVLIEQQCSLPLYEIGLDRVRGGDLVSQIQELLNMSARCIIVMDAATEDDLIEIAHAGLKLTSQPLFVGAAGLANALPPECYVNSPHLLPVLVIAGSMSEATWYQIEHVRQGQRVETVDIDVRHLLENHNQRTLESLARQGCEIIQAGKHCIFRTCRALEERDKVDNLCQQYGLSRQQLGEKVSRQLGALTLKVINGARIGALFLTGGDIATAIAQALGAAGYRIHGEVAPCIPWGVFINSEIDDLPVITKGGGFGSTTTLRDCLEFIEEMYFV